MHDHDAHLVDRVIDEGLDSIFEKVYTLIEFGSVTEETAKQRLHAYDLSDAWDYWNEEGN